MAKDGRCRYLAESISSLAQVGTISDILAQIESSDEVDKFLDDGR